ncbi:hypothetical protein MARA_23140 [Mycolicibacterium arabiense]|uniref:ANTAR domain-containing protein n=2 Tax=Mycolicibacterium arabiense TaxID=1286181 RepID=A0A7I7RXU9_9MYCO|nr:hypothetical protein MARA_23140 [Mycolicibacterium arabiense]
MFSWFVYFWVMLQARDDIRGEDRAADRDFQDQLSEAVQAVSNHRAVIEQAKGMLMLLHDLDADAAFELLRWRSQDRNVKLRVLAEQVVAEFRRLSAAAPLPREVYDRCFMNAHERSGDASA